MKPALSEDLTQQWATRINRSMAESVAAIIATGQAFLDAKRQLKHGGWHRLFAGHPQAVAEPVRCTVRTAQRLMAVATHPVLSNATHGSHLPPSWRTLYELTKLPDDVLEAALHDGRITPALERRQVRALLASLSRPNPGLAGTASGWDFGAGLERLRSAVEAELKRGADRDGLVYILRQIIKVVEVGI